jgi:hypothetical protein
MQDMWRRTVFSRVLQGVLHKGEIQLLDAGVVAYIFIKKITTTKCKYIEISYTRILK